MSTENVVILFPETAAAIAANATHDGAIAWLAQRMGASPWQLKQDAISGYYTEQAFRELAETARALKLEIPHYGSWDAGDHPLFALEMQIVTVTRERNAAAARQPQALATAALG